MSAPQPGTSPSCADDHDPGICTVAEARARIAAAVAPVPTAERKALREALGRVLADEVIAPHDVPGHTNAAMDGYALAAADLPAEGSRELAVAGTALAGGGVPAPCSPGQCVRIMTGAAMPAGADTVVMQERVEDLGGGRVRIGTGHRPGQNVRQAGEDLAAGSVALAAGRTVTAADLGILASLGIGEVAVRRRPRVAFFSTGDELRSIGDVLEEGQLYDSNRYTLYGMLARLGVEVLDLGVVHDEPERVAATLAAAAATADAVITSGGVSVGEADYIKPVLGDRGHMDFWKIAMKPGRPLTFGRLGQTLFFGLPGNPVAVMVTFYQFVQPAIHALAGRGWQEPLTVRATSAEPLRKRAGRYEFRRGALEQDDAGNLTVRSAGREGSAILTSMSAADCFILLPESCAGVAAGETVLVQPFAAFI